MYRAGLENLIDLELSGLTVCKHVREGRVVWTARGALSMRRPWALALGAVAYRYGRGHPWIRDVGGRYRGQ